MLLSVPPSQDKDDPVKFHLPFENGKTYKVWQGNDDGPSHRDKYNKFCWDFSMRVGTPVHAAAEGVVVAIKQDTKGPTGNWSDNNYVKIRHADGTETHYLHIKHEGAAVKVDQVVLAGDVIAYSGNTGSSTAPHLHFGVFRDTLSIPSKFEDVGDDGIPVKGDRVTSGNVPARSAYEEKAIHLTLELFDLILGSECLELLADRMAALEEMTRDRKTKVEPSLEKRSAFMIKEWRDELKAQDDLLKELAEKHQPTDEEFSKAVWIANLDEKKYKETIKQLKKRASYILTRKALMKDLARRKAVRTILIRELDVQDSILKELKGEAEGKKKPTYESVIPKWEKFIRKYPDWKLTEKFREHLKTLKK